MNNGIKKFKFEKIPKEDLQEMFIALLATINKGISDKLANVNIEAIALFLTVIGDVYKNINKLDTKSHKTEFGVHITQIIDNLLIKMTDNNKMLATKA